MNQLPEDSAKQVDITKIIKGRMKTGRDKYGHGLKSEMDTRQWGTLNNSWLEMAEEEHLDAIVYVLADYVKCKKISRGACSDDNDCILALVKCPNKIESDYHKETVLNLLQLIMTGRTKYHQYQFAGQY